MERIRAELLTISFAFRVAAPALNLSLIYVFTNFFGIEGYGEFIVLYSYIYIGSIAGSLGAELVLPKILSSTQLDVNTVFVSWFKATFVLNMIISVVMAVICALSLELRNKDIIYIAILISCWSNLMAFAKISYKNRPLLASFLDGVAVPIGLVVFASVSLLSGKSLSYLEITYYPIFLIVTILLFINWKKLRTVKTTPIVVTDYFHLMAIPLISLAAPYILNIILQSSSISFEDIGYSSVILKFSGLVLMPMTLLNPLWVHRFASDDESLNKSKRTYTAMASGLSLTVMLLLAILKAKTNLIPINEDFTMIFWLILLMNLLFVFIGPLGLIMSVRGMESKVLKATLAKLALQGVGVYIMISWFTIDIALFVFVFLSLFTQGYLLLIYVREKDSIHTVNTQKR
jgi:O-antigen/teichoic acid export membrane protein